MLTNEQKEEYASLRIEIINLNILSYFFIKKINRLAFLLHETTREYLLEEFIALRYMENGMILHLTNLDDDVSDFSFKKAAKIINKTIRDQKLLDKLNKSLTDYRKKINKLKVGHRNRRIAHLNYLEDLNFDEFLNFETGLLPLVIQANTIAHLIWAEKIDVKFKLGSYEGFLDFRRDTETLKIDVNKIKGFA